MNREIKGKKLVQIEQIEYKYISNDGKFSSEYSHEVDAYEREQRRPYVEEYKRDLTSW